MKNIFSIDSATQKLQRAAKRFPISVLFIIAFAFLFFIDDKKIGIPDILFIFFSFGAVISAAAVLWIENFVNYIKQQSVALATVLLWGVYCFFLPINGKINDASYAELVAIGIAVFLSLFFISFLKKDKDKAFWNFTIQTSFQFCIAVLFGLVIFIGLSVAVYAFVTLFDIYTKFIEKLSFTCVVLFAPIYSLWV